MLFRSSTLALRKALPEGCAPDALRPTTWPTAPGDGVAYIGRLRPGLHRPAAPWPGLGRSLTLPHNQGTWRRAVGVGVRVDGSVGVRVGALVDAAVDVAVGVRVAVIVSIPHAVAVGVAVAVGLNVGVAVGLGELAGAGGV